MSETCDESFEALEKMVDQMNQDNMGLIYTAERNWTLATKIISGTTSNN